MNINYYSVIAGNFSKPKLAEISTPVVSNAQINHLKDYYTVNKF